VLNPAKFRVGRQILRFPAKNQIVPHPYGRSDWMNLIVLSGDRVNHKPIAERSSVLERGEVRMFGVLTS
jgi:hypothetical protein